MAVLCPALLCLPSRFFRANPFDVSVSKGFPCDVQCAIIYNSLDQQAVATRKQRFRRRVLFYSIIDDVLYGLIYKFNLEAFKQHKLQEVLLNLSGVWPDRMFLTAAVCSPVTNR